MARRQTTTFSMSFLDVISCGFGAVVLFYTIISAQAGLYRIKETTDLSAEARKLEQEVLEGYKHLAELRNALDSTEDRKLRAVGTGSRPLLLRTEMGAGHGGPSGRYDAWRDEAQVIALLRRHYGEDVDIAPAPADILALAAASLANIPSADLRLLTRKMRGART